MTATKTVVFLRDGIHFYGIRIPRKRDCRCKQDLAILVLISRSSTRESKEVLFSDQGDVILFWMTRYFVTSVMTSSRRALRVLWYELK
jgi:hypothetical protein